jgi:putative transposase
VTPRQVIAGRTHLMTRRCTQRQHLLRPDALVEQIYLYCLGVAVERYGITLHGFLAMSNHQHVVVRDNRGNFPEFLAYHHRLVANAMNVHRRRSENFWSAEQANAVYLVAPEDRFAKLVYLLANPVASDLVDRVADWPGASSLGLNLSGRTRTVTRPRCFFREDGGMPAEVTLRVERIDGFDHLTDAEWVAKLQAAVHAEEERARATRRRAGRGVLGRKEILRTDPFSTATTPEPRRRLRPWLACRDGRRRAEEIAAFLAFQQARRARLLRMLDGDPFVLFPHGTYRVNGLFFASGPPSDDVPLVAA